MYIYLSWTFLFYGFAWVNQGTAIRDRIQERLRGQQGSGPTYLLPYDDKIDDDDDDEEYYYGDEDEDDEEYYYDDEDDYEEEEEDDDDDEDEEEEEEEEEEYYEDYGKK